MMTKEQTETLIVELQKLNKNLENLPHLIQAMNLLSLKIERHIKLGR